MKSKKDTAAQVLPDEDITRIKTAQRIGVMGGTFDPVHYGHLAAAEAVRAELDLDLVIFMPAGVPAFKRNKTVTDGALRYAMVKLATAGNSAFYVSAAEIVRTGITYTVDTAKALRNVCRKEARLYFITGADAFADIMKWKNVEELFSLVSFIVVDRPCADSKKLDAVTAAVKERFGAKPRRLVVPGVHVSSSSIRDRAAKGKPLRYLMPDDVINYIADNGLYAAKRVPVAEDILRRVGATQSEKRFEHTRLVAAEAHRLALLHGADADKAYLAGVLHDAAKGMTDAKLLDRAKRYGVELDEVTTRRPGLAHAAVGAEMARREYGIEDEDILNAIRYHTTGRPGMSLLEKLLFTADYIEPSRAPHEYLYRARACADFDLDAAVITILEGKLNYNRDKELHPLNRQAYEYMTYHYMEHRREDI